MKIDEVDGRNAPLGVSFLNDDLRGRRVVNFFHVAGEIYLILEPLQVLSFAPHDDPDDGNFLVKAGAATPSALTVPCNLDPTMIGRTLTDARCYPDHVSIELDLGKAGITLTRLGQVWSIAGWTRPKAPAIN